MSRLNSQSRLSQGPRDLETPGSALVTPQRIAPASTTNLGAILQGAVQVSAQVVAQNKAAQQRQDAEDFQTTLNILTELEEEYNRDPTDTNATHLLQNYNAARDRFTDPSQQAQLIKQGEPFKTRLDQEAEAREVASVAGYIDRGLDTLFARLLEDTEFRQDLATQPLVEQMETIRGEAFSSMPSEMLGIINAPQNEALRTRFHNKLKEFGRVGATDRQEYLNGEIAKKRQYAVNHGITEILDGKDVSETFTNLRTKQGIPEEEIITQVAESLVGNIKSAEANGSLPQLGQYLRTADEVLGNVSPRYGKERSDISAAVSRARQSIGTILSETLTNRANVAKAAGATDDEVKGAVVDRLLLEAETVFSQDFTTEADLLTYQPQNQAERGIHQAMLDAYKSVQVEVEERSKTVNNAIAAAQNPENTPQTNLTAPLSFGPEDLTPYLDGLQESVEDPSTLRLLDAARTDRGALYNLIASISNNTSGAGAIARAAGSEHLSGDTVTPEGLRQVFATLEGLGGDENIHLVVDGAWDKNYALTKVYNQYAATGQLQPELYNTALQQYRQAQFETRSGERQDLATALQDQKVFDKITGKAEGQFTPQQLSILMQTVNIGDLRETGSGKDTDFIATKVKEAMGRTGVYPVMDSSLGSERRFVGFTTSTAVPEAIGQDTRKVEEGLNNYLSRADRFLGLQMSGGENRSVWQYAISRIREDLPDARGEVLTLTELFKKRDAGEARIVLNTAAAGETVPVVLVLTADGQQPRRMVLGSVNFSSNLIKPVVKSFGSGAFASPRKPVDKAEQVYRNSGLYFEHPFDSSGPQHFE